MKKTLLLALAGIFTVAMVSTPKALEVDAVTALSGQSPTGYFYTPLMNDVELVTGITTWIPGSKSQRLALSLDLGVNTHVPMLGRHDITVQFRSTNGQSVNSEWQASALNISKTWLFKLTDQVNVGLRANILNVSLNGGKNATFLGSIVPVIGATINFME